MATKGKSKKAKETENATPEKGEKKKKAPKKPKEVVVVEMTHKKAEVGKEIHPATGSRFAPNTSKQIALEHIVAAIADGKDMKDIRKSLGEYKKQNGQARSLDAGYLAFCVATHPEYFEAKSDGSIKLLKEFKPDPAALKKYEEAQAERAKKKTERTGKKEGKKVSGEKKGKGGKPKKPTLSK